MIQQQKQFRSGAHTPPPTTTTTTTKHRTDKRDLLQGEKTNDRYWAD